MNKTRIEWADYTWNPIKGLCPEECWYCYARSIYRRFGLNPIPTFDAKESEAPWRLKTMGNRIFVCSTFELFNPIADNWRKFIFARIEASQEQTFIILTKRPERIDRPMPPNVHLGVSVTKRTDLWRLDELAGAEAKVKFASFEPILEPLVPPNGIFCGLNWAILGRLTGHGKKNDPSRADIDAMLAGARLFGVPIFMKENLGGIWGNGLIQEFPI